MGQAHCLSRVQLSRILLLFCVAGLWAGCTPSPSPLRVDGGGAVDGGLVDGSLVDGGLASGTPLLLLRTCVSSTPDGACDGREEDMLRLDAPTGECRYARLELLNVGDGDLHVEAPVLSNVSVGSYTWQGERPAAFTLGAATPDLIASRILRVQFCPTDPLCLERAQVLLRSNDPQRPEATVSLQANGGGEPPYCSCTPSTLEVAPGDPIPLRNFCSGCRARYHWELLRGPAGALVAIANPDAQFTTATTNSATSASEPYVFRVTLTDEFGLTGSCDLTVFVVPRDALHVQLVWDSPADLDLHLLNPAGAAAPRNAAAGWFSSPNDCNYANRTPDWGVAGNTADNPRLDLDATRGSGPENFSLSRPSVGTYRIGVHDYCEPDGGTASGTSATVRIFCNGQLTNEFGPRRLAGTGAFWEVADVQWPGCTVSEIGTLFESGRSCIRRPDGGP